VTVAATDELLDRDPIDEHRWSGGRCIWCHATEPGLCPWTSGYLVWNASIMPFAERAADSVARDAAADRAEWSPVRTVDCPTCAAPAGRPCVSDEGLSRIPHGARRKAAA
jgi:hypothetical protein